MKNSGYDDKKINNNGDADLNESESKAWKSKYLSGKKSSKAKIFADGSAMQQYIEEMKELATNLFKKKDGDKNKKKKPVSAKQNAERSINAKKNTPAMSVTQMLDSKKENGSRRRAGVYTTSSAMALNATVSEDARANVIYARRTLRIWIISLAVVILFVQLTFFSINHFFFSPPSWDGTKVEFEVPRNTNITKISETLYEEGFIKSPLVFKIYAQFTDQAYKLKSGIYELSKNMTIGEILNAITRGEGEISVVKLTIIEGKTIENMASQLKSSGFIDNTKTYYELTDDPEQYIEDYSFLSGITNASERKHFLEGYLFPDTYEVYTNSSADTIIRKQLNRFRGIYTSEYEQRAKALGMTMDQVITLASMIEKEAKTADFKKVSAVFHNRLDANMALQSCATVQFAKNITRISLTDEDTSYDSPYNTYLHKGLPVGPICSPGKKAIEAALWPDETYVKGKYLYFCVSDPETGATVFAKTYAEHLANIAKYKPLWDAYDASH